MRKSIPFAFNFFYFAAIAFTLPYVVLFYQGLGYSGAQIGLLAGMIPFIIMIGAPLWTRLADEKNCHRLVMSLTIGCTIMITAVLPLIKTFYVVLAVSILYAFFISPIVSLVDSATMHMLGSEKNLYGRVRMGGTFGYGLTALLAGSVVQTYGTRWVFWGCSLTMVVLFVISQKLVYPSRVVKASTTGHSMRVFASRQWVVFLLLAGLAGLSLSVMNTYLSPYLKELGISQTIMGTAILISTCMEVPILFYSDRLLNRLGAFRLILLSIIMSGVRMLLYAGANSTPGILAFQLLNGLTFPVFIVAAVSHANAISPEGMKATGQGVMAAALNGIGASIGGLLGGLLLGSIGGQALYLSIGLFVLGSVAVIALAERKRYVQPQEISG